MTTVADEPPLLAVRELAVGQAGALLRGVTFALRRGESWWLTGRNGSGKTTLVATLLGLVPARGGSIEFAAGVRSTVGYVPQEPRLEPALPLRVTEFVTAGIADGCSRREAAVRIDEALAALGIAALAHRDVRALSTGQRRRVAVARALASRPVLLVLDEPLANLDQDAAAALAADLDHRRQQGTCIVHVAHERDVVRRYATHVAVVEGGAVRIERGEAAAVGGAP